jgi:hypothetical protein
VLGLSAAPFTACGPDHGLEEPCDGPSFNLVVTADSGPLPAGTRINVRYGGNPEGEPYVVGESRTPQAVKCTEDSNAGGAGSADSAPDEPAGAGGAPSAKSQVWAVHCGLYTQGPARLDVTAKGYEPVVDRALSFESKRHCEVDVQMKLVTAKVDPGT